MTAGTGETREEKYNRQTTESFALLGRFVQAFEQMVNWARTGSIMVLSKTPTDQQLLLRVFHSEALTAGPLWDIFRNLLTTIVSEMMPALDPKQREATLDILRQLDGDYRELIKRRNQLLHGTWYIGWTNPQDSDFSEITVTKLKWKATGERTPPPLRDAAELKSLTETCDRVGNEIRSLAALVMMSDGPCILESFTKVDRRWVLSNTLPDR